MSNILQTLWHKKDIKAGQMQMEMLMEAKLASGNFCIFLWSFVCWHGAKTYSLKNLFIWKVHMLIPIITCKIAFLAWVLEKSVKKVCNFL